MFILIGLVLLLVFFFSLAVVGIRTVRDDINLRWYNLVEKLQYRQDLVPNLIETLRTCVPESEISKHKELVDKIIEVRARAARNVEPGSSKIVVEKNLGEQIIRIMNLGPNYNDFGRSTNYLELKKDFADLDKKIKKMTDEYNEKVKHHNLKINRFYNFIPAKLMNYGKKEIFEFS